MSRRLPVYFLIDVSESMVGEPMREVEEGMATIIKELKTDPNAIETAWISVVVFAGNAKTLVPLQEIVQFYPPRFPVGSGTSLSKGLGQLMYELRKNFMPTTYEQKGDWKPVVFLFTDGVPTDDTKTAIEEWKKSWSRTANLVAISFGEEADTQLLSTLTENVILFKNKDSQSYKQFFKWVTDSIKTNSERVENNKPGFELPPMSGDVVSKIDLTKKPITTLERVDSNFVVLNGKCQNTKRLYLLKYKKTLEASPLSGLQTRAYKMEGAFAIDDTYSELSGETAVIQQISTEELVGGANCPCCGNYFSLAVCQCGGIHCIGDAEMNICPWCGNTGHYTTGEGGFDINRKQG